MDTNLDERINTLQRETKKLTGTVSVEDFDYSTYAYIGCIFAPFVLFAIIYNTKLGQDDGEKDRKKTLWWTSLFTVILWGLTYGALWWFQHK